MPLKFEQSHVPMSDSKSLSSQVSNSYTYQTRRPKPIRGNTTVQKSSSFLSSNCFFLEAARPSDELMKLAPFYTLSQTSLCRARHGVAMVCNIPQRICQYCKPICRGDVLFLISHAGRKENFEPVSNLRTVLENSFKDAHNSKATIF